MPAEATYTIRSIAADHVGVADAGPAVMFDMITRERLCRSLNNGGDVDTIVSKIQTMLARSPSARAARAREQ
ncbi:hypothetical protein GCM10027018_21660 [Paenibacillus thermoaerophilus]